MNKDLIKQLSGGLVVSCQAFTYEPLYSVDIMARLAISAEQGGACAVRACWPENVAAIRKAVKLPIFGINKLIPADYDKERDVIITPTLDAARAVYYAGADIIAVDCTVRSGRTPDDVRRLVRSIKDDLDVYVMAEIATLEEGIAAESYGADIISTTEAGYTVYSRHMDDPDYELVEGLVKNTKLPINAEGRFETPEQCRRAFDIGAWVVTVGSAITRPHVITRRFVKALK